MDAMRKHPGELAVQRHDCHELAHLTAGGAGLQARISEAGLKVEKGALLRALMARVGTDAYGACGLDSGEAPSCGVSVGLWFRAVINE